MKELPEDSKRHIELTTRHANVDLSMNKLIVSIDSIGEILKAFIDKSQDNKDNKDKK
jgi:hypothetical protein